MLKKIASTLGVFCVIVLPLPSRFDFIMDASLPRLCIPKGGKPGGPETGTGTGDTGIRILNDGVPVGAGRNVVSVLNRCAGRNSCTGWNNCAGLISCLGRNICDGPTSCLGCNLCSGAKPCIGLNVCETKLSEDVAGINLWTAPVLDTGGRWTGIFTSVCTICLNRWLKLLVWGVCLTPTFAAGRCACTVTVGPSVKGWTGLGAVIRWEGVGGSASKDIARPVGVDGVDLNDDKIPLARSDMISGMALKILTGFFVSTVMIPLPVIT
jgi:hypothetical protein